MTTVAETIARSLYDAGVRIVFGMPGGEVVAVLEALRQLGIRFELMHHEESAVFAADAYARATSRPGCALTTLGPGALNAVAGIGHAWLDRARGRPHHRAKAGHAAAGLHAPSCGLAGNLCADHQTLAQSHAAKCSGRGTVDSRLDDARKARPSPYSG